jgi:glucosamine 6-phosphate synthetase-like amidotransferase/phosphosugar isomerase protein
MLDCIKRVPSVLNAIIEKKGGTFAAALKLCRDRQIDEIVLVGSGTSNTSCITAKIIMEKLAGIRVTAAIPSEFLYRQIYFNPNALYVFVSQTGTSILTGQALAMAKGKGFATAVVSESADTPLAKEGGAFIDMGCGYEEYPMRTIGYSSSVLTLCLLALEIGLMRGYLTQREADAYISEAKAASDNIAPVIDKAMVWLDNNRRKPLRSDCVIFYGSGALYGVALEGAVKTWETPQIISVGYELEEGIHGPNFGYSERHCVISLNDGGVENNKAVNLARYMKFEKKNGFVVGAGAIDAEDLSFTPAGGLFCCLEFAAVVQVVAYRLAVDQGRDLFAPHDNSVMSGYFKSHDE